MMIVLAMLNRDIREGGSEILMLKVTYLSERQNLLMFEVQSLQSVRYVVS